MILTGIIQESGSQVGKELVGASSSQPPTQTSFSFKSTTPGHRSDNGILIVYRAMGSLILPTCGRLHDAKITIETDAVREGQTCKWRRARDCAGHWGILKTCHLEVLYLEFLRRNPSQPTSISLTRNEEDTKPLLGLAVFPCLCGLSPCLADNCLGILSFDIHTVCLRQRDCLGSELPG
jgi:hypothetical protein